MARPALSASRSVDVLDFLATFPDRGFTLSEIARAADINVASCHAVLSALTERGYLIRCPNQRTYTLGPALVAVGQAALGSQRLVARAREAADELVRDLDVPVLLSGVIGDDIVGLISVADAAGRIAGLRVGERVPLVPPVGAPFLAWSSEAAIEAWIGASAAPRDPSSADALRHTLALTRQRGFQVTLRAPDSREIASLMAEMAAGRHAPEYKDEMTRLINTLDWGHTQPETIEPETLYDVVLIAAPLFDQAGEAPFNLCLGGFSEPLAGATITALADRLVRTCLQIMREDRDQA